MKRESIELLIDHLQHIPDNEFDLSRYYFNTHIGHDCETPACIAGHANFLFADADERRYAYARTLARKKLGLNTDQANWLFEPAIEHYYLELEGIEDVIIESDHDIPEPMLVLERVSTIRDEIYKATPKQAAEVLQRFLDTGEVNWLIHLEAEDIAYLDSLGFECVTLK